MIGLPTHNFLYLIVDAFNKALYLDNGTVKRKSVGAFDTTTAPPFLRQNPKGWMDIVISFGTNQNYWSLLRSFTVPMQFIGDGATILRNACYSGKGYEEELYIVILKLNPDNAIYELEYKGRIDFSKHIDEPRKWFTVNTIEGGVLSYLTANESVPYEIPLSPNNDAAQLIQFDGVTLYDRYRYSMVAQTFVGSGSFIGKRYAVNFPFISNEGDSIGIVQGSQIYEDVGVSVQTYTQNSANYFFSSVRPIQVRVTGQISFSVVAGASPTNSVQQYFQFRTDYPLFDHQYTVLGTDVGGINPNPIEYTSPQDVIVNVDITINLAANEKLFFIAFTGINGGSGNSVTINLDDLYFSFKTINPPSTAYGISIYDLNKQLVEAMTGGRYTGESDYYKVHTNIKFTSTNALKNFAFDIYYGSFDTIVSGGLFYIKIPGLLQTSPTDNKFVISEATSNNGVFTILNVGPEISGFTTVQVQEPVTGATGLSGRISSIPTIKITYKDFFNDVNCLSKKDGAGIGMKIVNNTIYIEPKENIYKPDAQIFDIGEIANFKLHYSDELLVNELEIGYKSQDYRQRNGIYEFNTTTHFKFPVDSLQKKLSLVLKSRADCFGIEFIRSLLFNKPTTDTTGDNQSFVIDTAETPKDFTTVVSFLSGGGTGPDFILTTIGITYVPGDIIQITGSVNNNFTETIAAVASTFVGVFLAMAPGGPALVNEANVTVNIHFIKRKYVTLNRPSYSNIVGVLDSTVFNTELSPHKLMLNWGRYLRALLKQLDSERITFTTADKNSALSTTLSGVTISERQDENVSSLGDPLFMNRYGEFTVPVAISFGKVMQNIGTGYIRGTFYGVPLYFLPIGKMDAKPAINAAQSWKLLLAPEPLNDLFTLEMLSSEGIFSTDNSGNMIFTSILNSLHFNKYNFSLPAKYQNKDMYDDWFNERANTYVSKSTYFQKWQKTDAIFNQCITKGLGIVNVDVYDSNGNLHETHAMNIISDPSVPLPYVRNDYLLDISGFAEGTYFVVLSSGGVNLRISDPLDVRQSHPGTILFEASHTYNKYNTYFGGIDPIMLRVEGMLLAWDSDATFQSYTDELADNELIDGIPMQKRKLRIPMIPDWMDNKINEILLLNRTTIEGQRYSRMPESKKDIKEYPGTNLKSYLYEISRSKNTYGLATDETGSENDIVVTYTLDAQAFGQGEGDTFGIEVINE
ncbi:MAG: hypothetical protein Q8941_20550 [Bacteroidota bacterium]|nr:hypothetical protein [Bacteroidota bacterium]